MRVAMSGSHGLIGSALVKSLEADGHEVVRLSRQVSEVPGGLDAVVHLAGEGIGNRRWNEAHKRRVLESRTEGTTALARALRQSSVLPKVLVSGSAIGFYGDRGDEVLTESSGPGADFLSEVCRAWEASTKAAEDAGIRVVHIRTGIVLSGTGGALGKQLPLFRFGLGAKLGGGRQWQSWISLPDEVAAIRHCIDTDVLTGPVNLTAPNPVRNAEFTKALGHALHRPAVLTAPAAALRAALGKEMADELLLVSQRVAPTKLEQSGFEFQHPRLEQALAAVVPNKKGRA
ncbi:MAG TPA: TIGR01777 family oxidoreductase [Acidimicrobiales bacterium]|nr:TIGR01777 family oxidoreductase [Acidimicrobiales bacterium]